MVLGNGVEQCLVTVAKDSLTTKEQYHILDFLD